MYLVKFDDNSETAVDIKHSSGRRGEWEAHMPNGEVFKMSMKGKDDAGNFVISINDVDTIVSFRPTPNGYEVTQGQFSEIVTVFRAADLVFDESNDASPTPSTAAESHLRSPITGIVLDVFVSPGDKVTSASPLILIEAMKMENTLEAPGERTIDQVLVKPGDTVFVGDPLVLYKGYPQP